MIGLRIMGLLSRLGRSRLLRIATYGEPILREHAKPVGEINDDIRELAERMTVTMYENETKGIGLAAPQVGISLRLVVMDTSSDAPPPPNASPGELLLEPRMPIVLINPEITPVGETTSVYNEGCLSIPGIAGDVERPVNVRLRSKLLDDTEVDVECGGLLARCLQHEIDHLDGIMFVDRMAEEDRDEIAADLRVLEKQAKKRLPRGRR
jgi:peptide deformylase